jgi:hypothetical protein
MPAEQVQTGRIIDVIDATDPELVRQEARNLIDSGGTLPIMLIRGMGNAIEFMVNEVIRTARAEGVIDLLRIHGHGGPGFQSLAGASWNVPESTVALCTANLETQGPVLRRLAGYFSNRGRAWLMGCWVGKGERGQELLGGLAKIWNVPVTAGTEAQFAGGYHTFYHEGPTVTKFPGDG